MADGGGLSLREALAFANQDPATHDTITFAENLNDGTIFLSQGSQLVVGGDVTIDGDIDNDGTADITVSADTFAYATMPPTGFSQVFGEASATPITATLDGLIVRDGNDEQWRRHLRCRRVTRSR